MRRRSSQRLQRPSSARLVCDDVLAVSPVALGDVETELDHFDVGGGDGAEDVGKEAPAVEAADFKVVVDDALYGWVDERDVSARTREDQAAACAAPLWVERARWESPGAETAKSSSLCAGG